MSRTTEITNVLELQAGDRAEFYQLDGVDDPMEEGATVRGVVQAVDTSGLVPIVRLTGGTEFAIGFGYGKYALKTATRDIPEPEPGDVGRATVLGEENVRVFRLPDDGTYDVWASGVLVGGMRFFVDSDVVDYVPELR